jgi:hypothetical protein
MVLSAIASFFITLTLLFPFWITTFAPHPISIFFMAPLMVSSAAVGGWFFILTPTIRSDLLCRSGKILTRIFH